MMPRIAQLESYDECFTRNAKFSKASYCVADAYINPNESSQLWNVIQRNSHPWKTQYRHDHLVYGICIGSCKSMLSKFDKMSQKRFLFHAPRNFTQSDVDVDPFTFHHAIEDKIEFSDIVNECINYQLMKEYQLSAASKIQYCNVDGRREQIGDDDKNILLKKI